MDYFYQDFIFFQEFRDLSAGPTDQREGVSLSLRKITELKNFSFLADTPQVATSWILKLLNNPLNYQFYPQTLAQLK